MAADEKRKGTALITGASAGLGRELASLFAADGHDVVLVARSKSKLEELAHDLEKTHAGGSGGAGAGAGAGVKAGVIAADLGDHAAPAHLEEVVKARGLQIDFLVNNAGFGSNGRFLDLDLGRELQMLDVNCRALLELTHRFAKPMVERKFGRIMNVASTAGFQPGPFMSTYYASKAFVVNFTEALAFELQGTGVSVTCYCPGATATDFASTAGNDNSKLFQRSGGVADAKAVATHAYKSMMSGDVLAIHGALNWFGAVVGTRLAPRSMLTSIAAGLNKSPG